MPSPPEGAVRMRCYKLNLESEYVGIYSMSTPRYEGQIFGPFLDMPPPLTYSASDDSSTKSNPTSVVIQTAQIFRGITVAKDGTILTQNARATRSNRGNKIKKGEKSRQAAKIDKANDLVEESIAAGKVSLLVTIKKVPVVNSFNSHCRQDRWKMVPRLRWFH